VFVSSCELRLVTSPSAVPSLVLFSSAALDLVPVSSSARLPDSLRRFESAVSILSSLKRRPVGSVSSAGFCAVVFSAAGVFRSCRCNLQVFVGARFLLPPVPVRPSAIWVPRSRPSSRPALVVPAQRHRSQLLCRRSCRPVFPSAIFGLRRLGFVFAAAASSSFSPVFWSASTRRSDFVARTVARGVSSRPCLAIPDLVFLAAVSRAPKQFCSLSFFVSPPDTKASPMESMPARCHLCTLSRVLLIFDLVDCSGGEQCPFIFVTRLYCFGLNFVRAHRADHAPLLVLVVKTSDQSLKV
jgi:hypothetical protein